MKHIKTVGLSVLLFLLATPAYANLVTPIDADATGWLKGGYGNNTGTHTVVPCNFVYPYADRDKPFHPQCPPDTRFILQTNLTDYVDGDVKWYFTDVPIGDNKNFVLSYDYQVYTIGAEVIARYTFLDGHYEYERIGDMPQVIGGMGYVYWLPATHQFTVPSDARSVTIFFSQTRCVTTTGCDGVDYGPLSIANVVLEEDFTTSTNLIPHSFLKGGWGVHDSNFSLGFSSDGHIQNIKKVSIYRYTSGDAKWYFKPVPVAEGTYTFSDSYQSTVPSEIGVLFKTPTGDRYQFLETLPASADFATTTQQILVPPDATALTVFHSIYSVGSLSTDSYSLTRN